MGGVQWLRAGALRAPTLLRTGIPRSYETPPPQDPAVAVCLGACGDPRGVGVSYERGTPVGVEGGFPERGGGVRGIDEAGELGLAEALGIAQHRLCHKERRLLP